MKKYFFTFFFFLFIVSSIGIFIITLDSIQFAKSQIKKVFSEKRIKEYSVIYQENKNYLLSLANYLSHSNLVKKGTG
jgi:hypothetical protein